MNALSRWILSLVVILMLSEPALPQETASSNSESNVIIHHEKGTTRWRTSTGLTDFNVEMRGKIDVTDDDKDIKSISDDGYMKITKTVFGSKRTIIIESLGGGQMKKEYYEGRTKTDWEPNGRKWLSEILPEIVRTTTLAAESRVNRFYSKGGASAVLSEISAITSDYVKAHYAKLLLNKDISSKEMPEVITKLGNEISSDYYLSTVLQSNIDKMLATSEAADAFFKATQKVSSDYYKSVILKEALRRHAASSKQVNVILKSAATINSDYYLMAVLVTLLEQDQTKEESLNDLIATSKNINSDYYRTEVLRKALQKRGISKITIKNTIDALADVNSDYYKTNVLNSLAEKSELEPDAQVQVIKIISTSVNSDYYASVTLKKLLTNQKLSDESFHQLVNTVNRISSSHYGSEILRQAATKSLSKSQLLSILKATENINSDHYLSEVLIKLAPQIKESDAEVKETYRRTAKKINSDTYYGRAMKAID